MEAFCFDEERGSTFRLGEAHVSASTFSEEIETAVNYQQQTPQTPQKDLPPTEIESQRVRTVTAGTEEVSIDSSSLTFQEPPSDDDDETDPTFSQRWIRVQQAFCRPILRALLAISTHAALHPWIYVVSIVILALSMITAGYMTNFRIEEGEAELWTPMGSRTEEHASYVSTIWSATDTNEQRGIVTVFMHKQSDNVVSIEGVKRVFDIVDSVRDYPRYDDYCPVYGRAHPCPEGYEFICQVHAIPFGDDAPKVCEIAGPTLFWFNNETVFDKVAVSDSDVARMLSIDNFPGDYEQFSLTNVIGFPEFTEDGTLESGTAFVTVFETGKEGNPRQLERRLLDHLLGLKAEWKQNGTDYHFEVLGKRSFPDEVTRGIVGDLPLIPLVFAVMALFTCVAFSKWDWVHSRCLLGFGAVSCVLLSLFTGYGLLFLCGVPLTTLTQLLPFVLLGIGLDDAFIISNAYARTDFRKDAVDRIHETMEEVGMSIFMTTATSAFAFALGCISSLPAIRWLCLYAFPLIIIDFIFQITFFIALIEIDERRVQAKRRDCFVCFSAKSAKVEASGDGRPREHFADRVMSWYADRLLKTWVKGLVVVSFLALFVLCIISALKLQLGFDFTTFLPKDSYIIPFMDATSEYSEVADIRPHIYFRNVDHSGAETRAQMENYVNDLLALDFVSDVPNFWVSSYNVFTSENEERLFGLSFNETLALFLEEAKYEHHRGDFKFDEQGNVMDSRTRMNMINDNTDVDEVLRVFREQKRVSSEQPINQNQDDWAFFAQDGIFNVWAFLSVTLDELKLTAVLGICAVSIMGALFLPHWSGILFVGPLVTVLYIDLMGMLQLADVTINGVSYIALTMSIGLLVDFIMHIAHGYFTSVKVGRQEKTKDVLCTMGCSVLLGGLSSFLGIMPLAFAQVSIFRTVFIAFISVVALGLSHGLILLPVILSMIGPE